MRTKWEKQEVNDGNPRLPVQAKPRGLPAAPGAGRLTRGSRAVSPTTSSSVCGGPMRPSALDVVADLCQAREPGRRHLPVASARVCGRRGRAPPPPGGAGVLRGALSPRCYGAVSFSYVLLPCGSMRRVFLTLRRDACITCLFPAVSCLLTLSGRMEILSAMWHSPISP